MPKKLKIILAILVVVIIGYLVDKKFPSLSNNQNNDPTSQEINILTEEITPQKGFSLPVKWGDLGKQLVDDGVIDSKKLEAIYQARGGITQDEKNLLAKSDNSYLTIDKENSGFLLNLLWALGLANKNTILENGPMVKNGDTGNLASTGGWNIAQGSGMDHYSKHELIKLNSQQQRLVEEVSKGIYRPCCDNSTNFPDCNHGMAMLGLLELLASQGANAEEMYQVALQVNSFWFPETYLAIAKYFQDKGIKWSMINPAEILGKDYSSSTGYQKIRSQVNLPQSYSGGCSV